MIKILTIICFVLLVTPAWSASFYVDCSVTNGTGGTGTYADPFESVADVEAYEAVTGFTDGDDIYFLEGSTCDDMVDDLDIKWEGASAENYSIIGCYDGDGDFDCDGARPILEKYGGTYLISLYQTVQYVRFEHLNLRNTYESWQDSGNSLLSTIADGSGGNGDKGYITITDCEFYHAGHYAVQLAQVGTNIIITDNTCTDSGNCFYLVDESNDGPSYGYIANNTCVNTVSRNTLDGHCVALQSTDYFIVENNTSTDAYKGAFVLGNYGTSGATHNVFRNNVSNRNLQHSFAIIDGNSLSESNLIYGNIAKGSGNGSDRPALRVDNYSAANGNYFFNNTVYDAGYGGLGIRSTAGNTVDYITYINNIVVVDGVTTGENELIWVEEGGTNGSNMTIDYNLYWTVPNTDPSGYALWGTPDDATLMTWANWKADGWGGNDRVVNPNFVDTTDFVLTVGSGAIDNGTFLTSITSNSASGTSFTVANTYILHDDMGLVNEDGGAVSGMLISLYDSTYGIQNAEITGITYGGAVVVTPSVNWIKDTTQISLRMYGTAPDIGAVEYESPVPSNAIQGVSIN